MYRAAGDVTAACCVLRFTKQDYHVNSRLRWRHEIGVVFGAELNAASRPGRELDFVRTVKLLPVTGIG